MTDVKAALAYLGWRVDTNARLVQAVKDFQAMWNLGAALTIDGDPGPATQRALETSLNRRANRLPDISPNFSAAEFACACGGRNQSCRRIWAHLELVRACEKYRAKVGPLSIVRGCRCPVQNAAVGGAKNSQHLYGTGADVEVYAVSAATVRSMRIVSGIGTYTYAGDGKAYVRHLDVRHVWGKDARNTTGSTIGSPATWSYGKTSVRPLALNPQRDTAPPPSEEDDDMAMTPAERQKLIEDIRDAILWAPTFPGQDGLGGSSIRNNIGVAAGNVASVRADVTALKATVAVLANSQGLDPGLVQKTISDAVAEALSKITLTTEETP